MGETRAFPRLPEVFPPHRVLKDGSCFVVRLDLSDGPVICKLAKGNAAKLRKEADRIRALRARFPSLERWMPAILGEGVLTGGRLGDQPYYLQEFIAGPTLADTLQDGSLSGEEVHRLLAHLVGRILDYIAEHQPQQDEASRAWLGNALRAAQGRLGEMAMITTLFDQAGEVRINGRSRRPLAHCLEEILASPAFARLQADCAGMSPLGHWNFHAQNIILNDGRPDGFAIIDPDPSLDQCDPYFGLARLLYSFPHDLAEQQDYGLHTGLLVDPENGPLSFDVDVVWSEAAVAGYGLLYHGVMSADGLPRAVTLDARLGEPLTALRLELCLLLCLIRGVAVNYESGFHIPDGNLRRLQNKGVFLFLNALDLANAIAEKVHG